MPSIRTAARALYLLALLSVPASISCSQQWTTSGLWRRSLQQFNGTASALNTTSNSTKLPVQIVRAFTEKGLGRMHDEFEDGSGFCKGHIRYKVVNPATNDLITTNASGPFLMYLLSGLELGDVSTAYNCRIMSEEGTRRTTVLRELGYYMRPGESAEFGVPFRCPGACPCTAPLPSTAFLPDQVPDFTYMGCYRAWTTEMRRSVQRLPFKLSPSNMKVTRNMCARLAAQSGYRYFGLQLGGVCMGANAWAGASREESGCGMVCAQERQVSYACGSDTHNSMYQLNP